MGNERATLAARGVLLAPRGSARDEALRELLRRERAERFRTVELLARLLAEGLRLPTGRVEELLEPFHLEVTHDRYRPAAAQAARSARSARKRSREADEALLSKLEKLTVKGR